MQGAKSWRKNWQSVTWGDGIKKYHFLNDVHFEWVLCGKPRHSKCFMLILFAVTTPPNIVNLLTLDLVFKGGKKNERKKQCTTDLAMPRNWYFTKVESLLESQLLVFDRRIIGCSMIRAWINNTSICKIEQTLKLPRVPWKTNLQ